MGEGVGLTDLMADFKKMLDGRRIEDYKITLVEV